MAMGTSMMGSLPAGAGTDAVTRNRARRQRLGEMSGMAGPNNPVKPAGPPGPPGAASGGWRPAGGPPPPPPPEASDVGAWNPAQPWQDPGFATSGGGPDHPLTDEGGVFNQGQDAFLPTKALGMDAAPGNGGGMAGVYGELLTRLSGGRDPYRRQPGNGGMLSYGNDAIPTSVNPASMEPNRLLPSGDFIDNGPAGGWSGGPVGNPVPPQAVQPYDWMSSYLGGGAPGWFGNDTFSTPAANGPSYGIDTFTGSMPPAGPTTAPVPKPDMPVQATPKPKPNLGPRQTPNQVDLKARRRSRRQSGQAVIAAK